MTTHEPRRERALNATIDGLDPVKKMQLVASLADDLADAICEQLRDDWRKPLRGTLPLPHLREVIADVLTETSAEEIDSYDWISECLTRRQEVYQLNQQLLQLPQAEWNRQYQRNDAVPTLGTQRAADAAVDDDEGARGNRNNTPSCIVLYFTGDNKQAWFHFRDPIAIEVARSPLDSERTIVDDILDNKAMCYIAGDELVPTRSVTWAPQRAAVAAGGNDEAVREERGEQS